MNLNKLSEEIYAANKEKGFWDEERTNIECLALAAGECHEAIEADRKGRYTDNDNKAIVDHALNITFKGTFKQMVKDTMEDEVADAIIRLLDFCGARRIDIDWHINNKLRYNATREHKHGKKY